MEPSTSKRSFVDTDEKQILMANNICLLLYYKSFCYCKVMEFIAEPKQKEFADFHLTRAGFCFGQLVRNSLLLTLPYYVKYFCVCWS